MQSVNRLLQAVRDYDVAVVQRAVGSARGTTAQRLHCKLQSLLVPASEQGRLEIVRLLLARGVGKVYLVEALLWAARWGYAEVVVELLSAGALVVPSWDLFSYTAVHFAACGGSVSVLEVLQGAGADMNSLTAAGESPVAVALQAQRWGALRWLIAHGASLQAGVPDGFSLLHEAARSGQAECVRQLLLAGVQADSKGPGSLTPLCLAAAMGQEEAAAALLAADARVDGLSPGVSPLCLAAAGGHVEVVRQLLAAGADVSLVLDVGDCDALQVAGVDAMALMACEGGSALHVACWQGHDEVIAALVAGE
jgi:ankyrin repeat protein